jgi:hypothetical protein
MGRVTDLARKLRQRRYYAADVARSVSQRVVRAA